MVTTSTNSQVINFANNEPALLRGGVGDFFRNQIMQTAKNAKITNGLLSIFNKISYGTNKFVDKLLCFLYKYDKIIIKSKKEEFSNRISLKLQLFLTKKTFSE